MSTSFVAVLMLTLKVAGAPARHASDRTVLPNHDPRQEILGGLDINRTIKDTFKDTFELGDLTLLSVTDVHSWLAGHRHPDNEPALDADYGDLVSFHQHLLTDAAAIGKDVLLFNSGDMVDGTGLSDATDVHGEAVFPLVQQVSFDALVIGNRKATPQRAPVCSKAFLALSVHPAVWAAQRSSVGRSPRR